MNNNVVEIDEMLKYEIQVLASIEEITLNQLVEYFMK
jgi:hypothetical protein